MRIQGNRQRLPHKAATEDNDVSFLHGVSLAKFVTSTKQIGGSASVGVSGGGHQILSELARRGFCNVALVPKAKIQTETSPKSAGLLTATRDKAHCGRG